MKWWESCLMVECCASHQACTATSSADNLQISPLHEEGMREAVSIAEKYYI
jgi:hypothetical protein